MPDRRLKAMERIMKGKGPGRPKKVGHRLDPPKSSRFYAQLDEDDLFGLVIPSKFRKQLNGSFPRPVKLKTCPVCTWDVRIELDDKSGNMF